MMIHIITPSVDYNQWLNTKLNESTNQNSLVSPKFLRKRVIIKLWGPLRKINNLSLIKAKIAYYLKKFETEQQRKNKLGNGHKIIYKARMKPSKKAKL